MKGYSSLIGRTALPGNVLDVIQALERRVAELERNHPGQPGTGAGNLAYYDTNAFIDASVGGVVCPSSTANVSNPPTIAQCEAEFGAADLGDGLRGVIDDNDGGATLWAVFVVNGVWGAEQLTVLS